jgi:hypothetical protein
VETGSEVIIERNSEAVAVMAQPNRLRRKISECIALMPAECSVTIERDFAVEAAIAGSREPLRSPI